MWDEPHLKALLRLPRSRVQLIQQEPWRSWLAERGGIRAVQAYLQTCNLSAEQRSLLNVILAYPYATTRVYAARLNIGLSTYFGRLRDLLPHLLDHLNSWTLPPAGGGDGVSVPAAAEFGSLPPHNLPPQRTSLIGAEAAAAAVAALLQRPVVRLVTVTGPGGIGKTRLALRAAAHFCAGGLGSSAGGEQFSDGVFWVALAPLQDAVLVVPQMARTLGIQEVSGRPLLEVLKAYLAGRRLLLLLDNFEHLPAAAALVGELLDAAGGLKILVTSRRVLGLYGEHEFAVPPLACPDLRRLPGVERLGEYAAVRLFVERARAVREDFELTMENGGAVAEICARLDGLPLAIELAAARIRLLTPREMLPLLERRLELLSGGPCDAPARQQSLRKAIEWSYGLLGGGEREVFERLAVFAGGGTLEAVAAVCGDVCRSIGEMRERLWALVGHSLVQQTVTAAGEGRFGLLETIREYALERLVEAGAAGAARRRHAVYYLELAEAGEREFCGAAQARWLERLEREHDNFRVVLRWCVEQQESEMALRLSGALWKFWQMRTYISEGRGWLEAALALPAPPTAARARIKVLWGVGWLAVGLDDYGRVATAFDECLELAQALGDRRGFGLALQGKGAEAQRRGDLQAARDMFAASLDIFRELGDAEETAWAMAHLGGLEAELGDRARAQSWLQQCLVAFEKQENSWAIAMIADHLGWLAYLAGDYAGATAYCEQALHHSRFLGGRWITALTLLHLGRIALRQNRLDRARALLTESLHLWKSLDMPGFAGNALGSLAGVATACGDYERAAHLLGASQALLAGSRFTLSPPEQAEYEHLRAEVRACMGPAAFAAAEAEGRTLTPAQAVRYALQ